MSLKKKRALDFIKDEYKVSRDWKNTQLHNVWASIIQEYKTNDVWEIHRWVSENLPPTQDALLATDGRMPKLNILIRKMAALLAMRNPAFNVEETNPGDEAMAWLLERYLDQNLRIIKFSKFRRQQLIDALICGTAVSKVGYDSQYVYGEPAHSDVTPRRAVAKEEVLVGAPEFGLTTEYSNPSVQQGMANAISVPPQDIFLDPAARVEDEIGRIYHRTSRRVIDIYHDVRFIKKARTQIAGVRIHDRSERTYPMYPQQLEREARVADTVEVFDLASRKFAHFSDEIDEPLMDWTPFPFDSMHSPYNFFKPVMNVGSPWGIPYGALIVAQARARNQVNAKILWTIGTDGKVLHLMDEEDSDPTMIDTMNEAYSGEIVAVPGLNQARSRGHDLVETINFPNATPELLRLGNIIDDNIAESSGMTDESRNTSSTQERSATEVATRAQQQSVTIDDMRVISEEHLEEVVEKLMKITLQFWDASKMIKVTGPDPRLFFWVPVERRQILKNFTLQIYAGSTQKMDRATQQRQIMELAQNFIIPLKPMIDKEAFEAAQGMPPSPVPALNVLKAVLEEFDPRMADKMLSSRDPVTMLRRLIKQHGIQPGFVSPELQQLMDIQDAVQADGQLAALANQFAGAEGSNVVPFQPPSGQRVAAQNAPASAPASIAGNTGRTQQDGAAFGQQRQLSQANGV